MWQELTETIGARQEAFDREIGALAADYRADGGSVHCGRGCQGCCSLAVHATFGEALRVAAAFDAKRDAALDTYVARLAAIAAETTGLRDYLRRVRDEPGACPFLDADGACAVYAARPFACRALLSTRPAVWCAVDLSTLDDWDRDLYLKSLDRATVDYPTHYLAVPRRRGAELEREAAAAMRAACGFDLSGNLAVLVYLQLRWRLDEAAARGSAAVAALLERSGLGHPLLAAVNNPLYSSAESGKIPLPDPSR